MIKFSKDHLVLAEKPYTSIQGEGRFVGIPMTYVRMQGCNVGCDWCDSKYTWYPYNQNDKIKELPMSYENISFEKLLEMIESENSTHIWFTGGEPMLQAEAIYRYLEQTKLSTKIYHICTAGTIYHEELFNKLDNITIDIKAPNSKTQSDLRVIDKLYRSENISKLELKMVVSPTQEDMVYAKWIANMYVDVPLTLQPLYVSETELADDKKLTSDKCYWELQTFAEWINIWARHYDKVRMGTQMHKHIWPKKTRLI